MFTVLTGAIRAAQKSQLLAQGPRAKKKCNCSMANCLMNHGLYDQKLRIGFFGCGSFVMLLLGAEPLDKGNILIDCNGSGHDDNFLSTLSHQPGSITRRLRRVWRAQETAGDHPCEPQVTIALMT